MSQPIRTLISTSIIAILLSNIAHAGSFSLYTEGSGYAIGNYAAGSAAEARDASTGWFNPAGLALFNHQQMVAGTSIVMPRSSISGDSTFRITGLPNFNQRFDSAQGAKVGVVPSFHYARPWNDKLTLGFSVVAPFGLKTDWKNDSPVRYSATQSELLTVNLSPEFGYKMKDDFLVGAGLDVQYANVIFNKMAGLPNLNLVNQAIAPTLNDTSSYNRGDSWGVGFHAGVMKLFNQNHTRFGLNYQSQMRHRFKGYSIFSGRMATDGATPVNGNSSALFRSDILRSNKIALPDILTFSAYHDLNEKLALLGSIAYTGWSSLQRIQLINAAGVSVDPNTLQFSNALIDSTSELHYRNTWRFSAGANYKVTNTVMMTTGVGFDQTPTVDEFRDVRVPDSDRVALSIGSHYQPAPQLGFDLGYTHLFAAENTRVNKTEQLSATSSYNVNAIVRGQAHIIGLQLTWTPEGEMTKSGEK
jgi:long-chain fatty acid transport protein